MSKKNNNAYIDSLINFFSQQSEPWGIKNTESVLIYANRAAKEMVGMTNRNVEGLTDADMECDTAMFATQFQQQDRLVEQTQKPKTILDIHPYANGWGIYTFIKSPLMSPTGEVLGTIFNAREFKNNTGQVNNQLFQLLVPEQKPISVSNMASIGLTNNEELILFFTLRGHNAKSIAKIFSRSPRTIEHTIERIRGFLGASNKSQLIEMSRQLGLYNMIPNAIFNQQISKVLS